MIETDNEKSESYEKEIEHLKNQIIKTNAELESRNFDDEITKKQVQIHFFVKHVFVSCFTIRDLFICHWIIDRTVFITRKSVLNVPLFLLISHVNQ
jgi:hypothetical protein